MSDFIADLLDSRRPGYALPGAFFSDPRVYEADLERIFARHWLFVASEPEIAESGDYRTFQIGRFPIFILRRDDGSIAAFHNTCRHRGSRILQQPAGVLGARIVCPYHRWSYDTEGAVLDCGPAGDAQAARGLHLEPVHVKVLAGLIFVCLAEEPPADFAAMAAEIDGYLAPHGLSSARVAHQSDLIEHGNWKLTLENNRECYHCVTNHPELTASIYEHGFGYQPGPQNAEGLARFEAIVKDSHARWEAMGLPSARLEELDTRVTGFRTQRLPLDGAGQSQTLNAEVACRRLLGDFADKALGGLSFWTQPNSWHHFMSDHVVSFSTIPLSAGKTLVRTTWCVHKDAVEGVDYDVANLTAVWNATNAQDRRLVEQTHAGVASTAYEPGPYSPYTEALVEAFSKWYVDRMRAGLSAPR